MKTRPGLSGLTPKQRSFYMTVLRIDQEQDSPVGMHKIVGASGWVGGRAPRNPRVTLDILVERGLLIEPVPGAWTTKGAAKDFT